MAKLSEMYDNVLEFETLLSDCSVQAEGNWEEKFVADMQERYNSYKGEMFISNKQQAILEKISAKT